jgi:hypothetical protein
MEPAIEELIKRVEFLEMPGVRGMLDGVRLAPLVVVVKVTIPLKLLILAIARLVEFE